VGRKEPSKSSESCPKDRNPRLNKKSKYKMPDRLIECFFVAVDISSSSCCAEELGKRSIKMILLDRSNASLCG
jgi:hypothetical protein